ncbi:MULTISPECIES: type I restriction endonuclease subunit R [unclassified Collinsella]|uniref:type I restriction endonuclease subunit R n=1 Tax=unclassified Collinsella TaxID=2637548 RepID=UPI000E501562|nr:MULTISPECIES: DEAD/DEAH box helicase family protein [unclassified Collinsella]RHJ36236.1 type I restriction endonuclease subunit R [Collinsella sp. AM10-48]RHJ36880.1 type I restriction endonuclease subunit R [Collinsella sp. AM10-32]RHJ42335.1 type I restriction endonuclease subunit R [Collinsella sp. AM10-26]RHJ46387.1 type I restriction endonuclease subunit R [Collinsella sp. AM10-27]RHJ51442.1 type I restriction endonuclease subunit R [Collinsella sp. AM10-11]
MPAQTKEKNLEEDIESFLCSPEGGFFKCDDRHSLLYVEDGTYQMVGGGYMEHRDRALDAATLVNFIQTTQPKAWDRFERMCNSDSTAKFAKVFNDAVDRLGMVAVLKHGFKHRGIPFKVVFFKPESGLNESAADRYAKNVCRCIRQFHFAETGNQTIDMVLDVNGIPLVGIELKDQFTGQDVENAMRQWREDRDPRCRCLKFNTRMVAFFAVDLENVYMTTKLEGAKTFFLPFNQGSAGAGNDGGAGNPANPDGYATSHLWEVALQKDSLLDIVNKFLHLEVKEETELDARGNEVKRKKERIIFPRYHQLDSVRKVIADVRANGTGKNYLVQHSAGSGKSNSIAWTAYRLASLFVDDTPLFDSVVVVTDRRVLDSQLQETISGFDHAIGSVVTIGKDKTSADLRDAINGGARLIVSTLQKFPVIYEQVESKGKRFAIIVDEAHSSQTGTSALKLKSALADKRDALEEYAEIEAEAEDAAADWEDQLADELASHGRHKNLTFVAFTATPKEQTLEIFGDEWPDGSFHPFHVYSMRQAIEEGFIMDPLANYVSYSEAVELARTVPDNPDVPSSPTLKLLRKYKELHPYALGQKAEIIVETFRNVTRTKIRGKGKMMVVTASRLATVRYYHEIKRYMQKKGYDDIEVLVAFSGAISDPADGPDGPEYTEPVINVGHDGQRVAESQTKAEFHNYGDVLVVAEKYQTGFDEPLLHTLVVDKKLKDVKAVQTLCRVNRIHPDKEDTYILDFVNKPEDIQKAFERFYTETSLSEQINTDLLYQVQTDIRGYGLYDESDIEAAAEIVFTDGKGKSQSNVQGKLAAVLKPAVARYNELNDDERYQVRRKVRSFCKWYTYITQIVRMFDRDLHKEYVYLSYLRHLLKVEKIPVEAVDDKVEMRFYKLKQEFEGSISLEPGGGVLDPGGAAKTVTPDKKRDPLQVLVDKFNEQWAGNFTEGDRVVIDTLWKRIAENPRVADTIRRDGRQVFESSLLPKVFDEEARRAYVENTDSFTSLFEDSEKYRAMMSAIGQLLVEKFK